MSAVKQRPSQTLRDHWPEYLIEAWALGTFMLSAAVVTTLVEAADSPLHGALPDTRVRRALIGLAMGVTAILLSYSGWGRRSGANMNPAVTLAFFALGRMRAVDAAAYVVAQFVGAAAGVAVAWILLGAAFALPPVNFVATVPGPTGQLVAFAAEMLISFGLMFVVLTLSSAPRISKYTGIAAGVLVALFVAVEAPFSGMSMNPARTLASALPGRDWSHVWLYFAAPLTGMLAAAYLHASIVRKPGCAKLVHTEDARCIHCGYDPKSGTSCHHDSEAVR